MNLRKILIFSLLFIALISLSSVAATSDVADINEFQDIKSNDSSNPETLGVISNDEKTSNNEISYTLESSNNQGNFTELQTLIDGHYGSTLTLNQNYTRLDGDNDLIINNAIVIDCAGFTIDANKNGRIFNLNTTGNLTLINAKLINGNASHGGVIYSENDLNLICDNVSFINNTADQDGGVIYTFFGSVNVIGTNLSFIGNTANNGGVIYAESGSISIKGNKLNFINNTVANYGGVIRAFSGSASVIGSDVSFINNNATYGGAISAFFGVISVNGTNMSFTENTATYGGVIYVESGSVIVDGSDVNFINNAAKDYGGVIHAFSGIVSVVGTNVNFIGNTAKNGGAIYAKFGINVNGSDVSFINNNATYGGAIDAYYGSVIVEDVIFTDNNATYGNDLYMFSGDSIISNSVFTNELGNNSQIYLEKGANLSLVNNIFFANHNMTGVSGVYQNCVLIILVNNKSSAIVERNEDFNLTAKLVDSQNNTYYSAGLTYQIYNKDGLIYEIVADNLFNAIANLTGGVHNITAKYNDPNKKITDYAIKNATVRVNNTVVLSGVDLIKYYKGVENYNLYLKLDDNPLAGETVAVTINGITYDFVTDNNGLISLPIGLSAGNYTISSVYNGSYGVASLENNITVNPTIVGSETELYYRNGTAYNVCVIDSQGKIVTSGKVRFNINGVYYDIAINNGTASLPIGLNAGKYVITAENPTNGEKTSNNVTVLPTLVGEDIAIYHRNGSGYSVKVLDGQGQPAKGVNVRMNVNGVFYNVKTDDNGIATLLIGLSPGDYIITAEYNGFKTSNKITVLPVLIGDDIRLYYRDGTSYKVKLVDGQGNPLVDTNVTMNINGVFYYRTTGVDGVADLPIGLLPGKYIITTTYQDHATSNTVTVLPRD